jgi:hypothetical protein
MSLLRDWFLVLTHLPVTFRFTTTKGDTIAGAHTRANGDRGGGDGAVHDPWGGGGGRWRAEFASRSNLKRVGV